MVKNLPASARDGKRPGSIPGWGRSPGGGQGNPLQYSCLENSLDRGAWWVTVHRVTKSWTQLKRLITACIQQFMNQAASYVVTRMALQRLVRNGSFIFLLEDSCFTICVSFYCTTKCTCVHMCVPVCECTCVCVYIRIPLPLGPPSHPHPTLLGHRRALSRAPCAVQPLPTSCLFHTW